MCIFSKPVNSVSATHIFVRRDLRNNRNVTIYQMEASLMGDNAMILPVPGTDVEFVNLEGYPEFFKDMDSLFPQKLTRLAKSLSRSGGTKTLEVHDVGQYIASYVPSMNDWDRIDPVFKLADNCWEELPDYSTFGFVVFQLKSKNHGRDYSEEYAGIVPPSRKRLQLGVEKFHPMAYTYTPIDNRIFFPTTHVHDGEVEKVSNYDHKLYYQLDDDFSTVPLTTSNHFSWEISTGMPSSSMNIHACLGLVNAFAPIARLHLDNVDLPNQDIILERQLTFGSDSVGKVVRISNGIREKKVTFGINKFAADRHFSQGLGFSFTTLSHQELCEEIAKNWDKRQPGMGETTLDRKVVVPISSRSVYGVYTTIKPDMEISAKVEQRQAGEDYFIECKVANPPIQQNKVNDAFAKVVLYSRAALMENGGTCSTDADWEVVCLISSDVKNEPMQPLAMARNMLEKVGGTLSTYTAQEFAEAIYYWSQRVKIS
jgi:hypothetical protein